MSLTQTLIERDGLSEEEAQEALNNFQQDIDDNPPMDYDELIERFESDFGLEPDYLEDFLF